LLGHSIEVRSRVGRGTVFRLVVPVTPAPTPNELDDVMQADDLDVSGLSVLVVDDEEPIRHAMSALLTSWGCIAHAAQDTAAALRLLPTSDVAADALLCDYRLTGETGLEVVASIRARWQRNTAALVVTGDISAAQLREIADSGLQVMHKPVNPVRLRSWLAAVRAGACH
jgi:CheY-like chemotaxis protein